MTHPTTFITDTCPCHGEALIGCPNPDHDKVTPDGPFFHRQRDENGSLRRGKPRKYCSPECSRWVDDHYWVPVKGNGSPRDFTRKVRRWTVPALPDPDTDKWYETERYRYKGKSGANEAVRKALADGYLDCDPVTCELPTHIHKLPFRPGDTVFYAQYAPALVGDGSLGESVGLLYLTPQVVAHDASPPKPKAFEDDDGNDLGDMNDMAASDPPEPPTSITARILSLLPKALMRFLITRNPPPPKAVAMVRVLGETDDEVRALYLDIVEKFPEYAEARATAAELEALVKSDQQ